MSELLKSDVAKQYNINNMPTDSKILDNLLNLIIYCLQPIREQLNKPIHITSGYRCSLLNRKVGGVGNSQHLTGQAADVRVDGMTAQQLFTRIKNGGVEYDQLINEYDQWVHISFDKNKNRKQAFKL